MNNLEYNPTNQILTDIKDKEDEINFSISLTTDDDDERPVYISGNFNNWHTQDKTYQMEKLETGKYRYVFSADYSFPEELLYKFTKGDWSEVEIDQYGDRTSNRSCTAFETEKQEHVYRWRRNWLPYHKLKLPKVELISAEFFIPQLKKFRKIWALLPHDYETSEESYRVLYLHDAQNLFDENAPYGNWEIDKKLAVMSDYGIGNIIVIAIEHGEEDRVIEYNVGNTSLGQGEGKKYIRFIADTLKPYVDKHYRTMPEREFTGIGGSSMGGLVSIFGGLMYPEVFGKLMIFSPSLWVIPKIKFPLLSIFEPVETKIYLYAGGDEGASMVKLSKKFKKRLLKNESIKNHVKIKLNINVEGQHNERYWSAEFPKAVEWLFYSEKD